MDRNKLLELQGRLIPSTVQDRIRYVQLDAYFLDTFSKVSFLDTFSKISYCTHLNTPLAETIHALYSNKQ